MTQIDLTTIFGTLVETEDGSWTVKHASHGQDFHSTEGAKFEAWQLYVVASGFLQSLSETQRRRLAVLDVGMGLGYNACATIAAWFEAENPVEVELTSLEIDHQLVMALAGGTAPWCVNWDAAWLLGPNSLQEIAPNVWRGTSVHRNQKSKLIWTVYLGDASAREVPAVPGGYHFVWQDPFTPELNPNMWSPEWFSSIRGVAAADAKLMTYSVARVVRDALTAGGWFVERFRTTGRKRHWLRAHL